MPQTPTGRPTLEDVARLADVSLGSASRALSDPGLVKPKTLQRVMQAVEKVTAEKSLHTRDLGGTATMAQVTKAVCDLLAG